VRYVFPPDVVVQFIGEDALILKLDREDVFALNPTGAEIARLLAERLDLDTIAATLSGRFGIDRALIAGDVRAIVEVLVAKGLLEPVTET
jgi:hypothetical protein